MSSEVAVSSSAGPLDSFESSLAAERAAELSLMRSITKSVVIGVPLGILFFIGLLAIALAGEAEWYVIVGLGAIMGVLAAALFGMLGGVTLVAHVLEDVDKGSPGVH
jgi:presenilin-like A22 family membrane protease